MLYNVNNTSLAISLNTSKYILLRIETMDRTKKQIELSLMKFLNRDYILTTC